MRLYLILSAIFFMVFLCACGRETGYTEELARRIECEIGDGLKDYSRIVIIPRRGCTGAIEQALHYYRYKDNRDSVLFIFTYVFKDEDLMSDVRDSELFTRTNVFVDNKNLFFLSNSIERSYPYEYLIKHLRIVKGNRFAPFF